VTWRRTLLFLAVLVAFYVTWLVYDLGKVNGVAGMAELRQEYAELEQRYHETFSENESLRKQGSASTRKNCWPCVKKSSFTVALSRLIKLSPVCVSIALMSLRESSPASTSLTWY